MPLEVRSLPNWFPRFRALEREACKHLKDKLFRAKSVIDMARPQKAGNTHVVGVIVGSLYDFFFQGDLSLHSSDAEP